MEVSPEIRAEWQGTHMLCHRSLAWLREHADPGDDDPIVHGIDELRRITDCADT